jgi:thiol-disulfide isomerase/thioredoxin
MRHFLVFALLLVAVRGQAQEENSSAPVLVSIDAGGLDSLRTASRGRVLVLNFWATWCRPCVEEFPELLKLRREFGRRGLDVVFVSIDDDDAGTKQKVLAFLTKRKASGRFYIKRKGDDEAFISAVSPKWSGALPATLIYDSAGRVVEMVVDQMTYFELEKIVKPLLSR